MGTSRDSRDRAPIHGTRPVASGARQRTQPRAGDHRRARRPATPDRRLAIGLPPPPRTASSPHVGWRAFWFSSIIDGEALDWAPTGPCADWHVGADDTAASVIDAYNEQVVASNAVLDRADPGAPPRRKDPLWDTWGIDFPNVRIIVLHMIVETATHAGHLDAVAELIDSHQHLVL